MSDDLGYDVVVEAGEHNFSAYATDLPGVVATGRTEEEVRREMAEAIEFHIEGLRLHGEPVPPPRSRAGRSAR
jgi:predicted RNase H-like HicB family nuclease